MAALAFYTAPPTFCHSCQQILIGYGRLFRQAFWAEWAVCWQTVVYYSNGLGLIEGSALATERSQTAFALLFFRIRNQGGQQGRGRGGSHLP